MNASRACCLACLIAAGVAAATSRPWARQATFTSTVEAVRIDALVREGARVVRGLGAADFQVHDNGVPQEVEFVRFEQWPLNVILVLDRSESIVGDRMVHLQAAGVAALAGLRDRDQAALVMFDHRVWLASAPTAALDLLRTAIRGIVPGGGTALYDAVHAGIVLGGTHESRSVVVVFTDGTDTASFLTKEMVLDTARRGDAVVYAVTEGRNTSFLKDVAEATGGGVTEARSTNDLPGLFVRILDEFRQRYLIGYSPKGTARAGWHRLEVSVKGRRCDVKTRTGYQVGP
jgi:Ca-activated chloride channel homolog